MAGHQKLDNTDTGGDMSLRRTRLGLSCTIINKYTFLWLKWSFNLNYYVVLYLSVS